LTSSSQRSYRQIMKATSLFGGVQFVQIVIQIIRSKVIALLLGPTGMGLIHLFTTTVHLLGSLTNFGLGTSAVKDIAAAESTENPEEVSRISTVLKRLIWATGVLGAVLTIILSPQLSELTFENREYTSAFIWLSLSLLFNQLTSGQLAVLQGLRKLKFLAKANLYGSFIGLLITLPLYYFFGLEGIVPAIIVTSLITLMASWFFSRRLDIKSLPVSLTDIFHQGKDMLKMGFLISLTGLLAIAASYILRIYITRAGGVDQVGLYGAGFAIIESYVGLVFTAMSKDYYPRLSAVHSDNFKVREIVNQQAVLALLILIPIILGFLIFSPYVVRLLYSREFLPITGMINWAILGIFFRAVSWSMGFVLLAKSDSKIFVKTAIGFNAVFLTLNIAGYYFGGLAGIGISFLVNYIIHFIGLLLITRQRYRFSFRPGFYKIMVSGAVLCASGFLITFIDSPIWRYSLGIALIGAGSYYSYVEMNKRLNIKELLSTFRKK